MQGGLEEKGQGTREGLQLGRAMGPRARQPLGRLSRPWASELKIPSALPR